MRRRIRTCILSVLLCLSAMQCFGCALNRASDDILPHLISEAQAEENPVRPIDRCETRGFTATTESGQLDELLEIVYKPWRGEGSKPDMDTALPAVQRIYAAARAVLDRYIRNDFSDYERVHAIHDWLAYTVTYDFDLLESTSPDASHPSFGLSGVFDEHTAVCDGFAKAMLLLCGIEQIPCIRVTGEYTDNGVRTDHAWNKVNIGGSWYHVDATMDSWHVNTDKKTYHILNHGYFLCSDDEMFAPVTGRHTEFGGGLVNYKCPTSYGFYRITALGIGDYAMEIKSQEALDDVFARVAASKRKIGKLELKLKFDDYVGAVESPDAYVPQITRAYRKVKDADFRIDAENAVYPYMRYPDGVFVFLIYK